MTDEAIRGTRLRKYPRLPGSFPVTFRIHGDGPIKSGVARDIGGGGVYFESAQSILPNALISIYFQLRPELNVEAVGRLISTHFDAATNAHHHRIMFVQVADDVREQIVNHIFQAWRSALMAG